VGIVKQIERIALEGAFAIKDILKIIRLPVEIAIKIV
jgi:hypothetical protein